ncbi:hypothetical protein PG996_002115 [Apiospora saccharicola]|uniref:DEAD/DEAH box helicase n=1 Tax=Apiospora saccharicola TaxID=335842 RepID=A0ABR1WIJ5_9PEZI
MDPETQPSSKKLLEWYQGRSSHRLDLIGDFAGKELFVIDANSLLVHCITQANILFHHLKHRRIDGQDSKTQEPSVYEFPRPDAPAFGEYLKANAVRCFVGLDGNVGDGADLEVQALYVQVLYQALKLEIRVAVLNDMEIRNNKIFANIISPQRHGSPVFNIIHPEHARLVIPGASLACDELKTKLEGYSVREKITTVTICKLMSEYSSAANIELEIVALVLHLVGMRYWALTDRNCKVAHDERATSSDSFFHGIRAVLMSCSPTSWLFQGTWDLFDLFDGRVFLDVYTGVRNKRAFPELIVAETMSLLRIIEDATNEKLLCHLPAVMRAPEAETAVSTSSSSQYLMLPFSQTTFDPYLPAVDLETDMDHADDKSNRVFRELWHWHNAKLSLEHKYKPKPKRFFARKRNQQFMADTIIYSASLTNSTGKVIDPETVVVQQDHDSKSSSKSHSTTAKKAQSKAKEGSKAKKQTVASGRQRALDAAKAIQDRKDQSKTSSVLTAWASRCRTFDEESSLPRKYMLALRYLGGLRKQEFDVVGPEVLLYICNILCWVWVELTQRKNDQNAAVLRIASLVYHHSTAVAQLPGCTKEISNAVNRFAKLLRLSEIPMAEPLSGSRPLPFKACSLEHLLLPRAAVEFQLQHCGPYLERSFDSRKDERVSFAPDAWQREVLDAIDAEKSLLVIAPTSAGKTFISFYAIKKVLQFDDDEVLVYIAPTKALVNQIAAEIQVRFSKTFRNREGRSVWAIHIRDYRVNNPTGCQILVTVPHILQIMLLSPSHAKTENSWSRGVKRIIFDEVHCIGQSEEGVVWEQLILMAPCPIIALSATVGNPDTFYEWLKVTQEQNGRSLCMIKHDSRYSDLRKFVYAKPKTFEFTGLKTVELYPSCSSAQSWDCLALWKAMANAGVENLQSLDPHEIFSGLISKAQVVTWEKRLKKELGRLIVTDEKRYNNIRSEILKSSTHSPVEKYLQQDHNIALPLLCDLHLHDGLPAIIFNHERYECERALQNVLQKLESSEEDYKKSSPKWQQQMKQYNLWEQEKATQRMAAKDSESKKKSKKNSNRWASFDPLAPLDGFSFADKTKLGTPEFEDMLRSLEVKHVPQFFVDGLRRGIGVHHAGMNRRYRQIVEILFRKGFLRAVIATGTLALGINMPCKTVVFMGDSIFHTALNYRQASGRAGRRGFDLLGNVVFAGIKTQRVFEIMSSKLPDLRGQFALSTTLVLRVLGLLHETEDNHYAVNIAKTLLTQNRLFLGGPESKMFVQYHLRFSIEYLRRQHLLSREGAPINFAGLVGHLYFTENAAFSFHALLKEGYLHRLCAKIVSKRNEVLEELALVMTHLFSRVYCTNTVRMSVDAGRVSRSVLLPNLPTEAEAILREHNKHILDIFTSTRDLCNNVRSGVFMEESSIPSLSISPYDTGGPLNAYLFNFYKHGDLRALSKDNKIHKGSVYNTLKDFTMILATIVASLKHYTNTDAVADDEDIMGTYDDEKDSDDEGGDAEAGGSGSGSGSSFSGGSAPSWANAEHGTLEHVQKAFAILYEEFDGKLWKHAS